MSLHRIEIDGMHCGSCVRRVTMALDGVDGVTVEKVEIGWAELQYDPAGVTFEQLAAALDDMGFTARRPA